MLKKLVLLLVVSGTSIISFCQENQQDSLKVRFIPYGNLRGHLAIFNDEAVIQSNASRIGFELSLYGENFRYFAGAELGINLFKSQQLFNADANSNSGFFNLEDVETQQVFTTRLGYLGIDFGRFGTVTIGKQWSVYYDVTGLTDKFNVFGGQGSATYVAFSDGGNSGTGRASQALSYRNTFGKLDFGAQVSLQNILDGHFFDGYGFSLGYEMIRNFKLAAAYNRAYIPDFTSILGISDQPEYLAIGFSFQDETWDVNLVLAHQTNGDLTETVVDDELVAAIFDANGFEVYAKYKQPRFSLIAGFNGYYPDVAEIPIDPDFELQYFVLGAELKPISFVTVYGEYRLTESTNQFGEDEK